VEQSLQLSDAVDPVCGMTVDPVKSPHRYSYRDRSYHFCSDRCCAKFANDPHAYLKDENRDDQSPRAGVIYTCPMHPEIRRPSPGACPICGMALEPEMAGADDGGELADMTRRFWISLALAIPLVAIDMGSHLHLFHAPAWSRWLQFALASPVVLWGGLPFFERGLRSLRTRHLNMFTLIAMGTGVAYCYSVIAAIAPQYFPPQFRDPHGGVALYFEAAAVITVLVLLGQVLELRARAYTSDAIRALIDLVPKSARRISRDGSEEDVPLMPSRWAIGCASGQAKRSRSTAWCWRVAPRSMNR